MPNWKSLLSRAGLGARERDVLLTGLPRSGTTLTCHLLGKLPDTVALHEPMDFHRFTPERGHDLVCRDIARFCRKQRRSIRERGVAVSKHREGRVPDNPVGEQRDEAGKRTNRGMEKGEIRVSKPLPDDFMLVVKHNSSFTAVLDALAERFRVWCIVRNPLAVLGSWNSIALHVGRGHVPAAERLDPSLARALAGMDDVVERQIHILSWFFGRYRAIVPPERVLRYEDVVESGGRALSVVNPLAAELAEPLESRNRNRLYDDAAVRAMARRLLETDGPYWHFYGRESVEELTA